MIKPIETWYAGCRFRSRLEARWAVFFDHLGIRWEYEAQGYELPSGSRYLPDFHLPEIDVMVEVKGDEKAFRDEAPRYAEAVQSRAMPGRGLLLLGPIPDASAALPKHLALVAETHCCGDTILCLHAALFDTLPFEEIGEDCYPVGYCTETKSHVDGKIPALGHLRREYDGYLGGGYVPPEWPVDAKVAAAYRTARSARFEHGERPARPEHVGEDWPPVTRPGGAA